MILYRILKEFAFEISQVLCNIINASLFQGLVPSQWKCAVIVPLPKMIPTPSLDKLRPVSLTSTVAKVTETFISKWMIQNMSQSLDSQQFGNRKGRSTSHYLVQLVQHIHQTWEDGLTANLLAVDYSKAFDRVDITVAIQKLIHMGVSSALIPWISDFLTDRKQCVRVNGATSEWYSVTCGVPQGTKVGPVVFMAMVNAVADNIPHRWKYVDDITIAITHSPTSPSNNKMECLQTIMNGIFDAADQDNMSINASKWHSSGDGNSC